MSSQKFVCVVLVCASLLVACGGDDSSRIGSTLPGDEIELDPPAPDAGASTQPDSAAPVSDAGPQFVVDAAPAQGDAGQVVEVADAGAPVVEPVVEPVRCTSAFYRDADADGFGDPLTALVSCDKPAGYVVDKTDCYDANALAWPGQEGRFTEHRGDGSFDYDCDGQISPAVAKVAACPMFTEEQHRCYPTNAPQPHPERPSHNCYEEMIAPWHDMRDGWFGEVAPCGEIREYGVSILYDRDHYTCGAPITNRLRQQSCN